MTLETAAALARDVAGIALALALAIGALTLAAGVATPTAAVAGALAVVAVAALGGFAFYGLLAWALGAPVAWIGIAMAAIALGGLFLAAHWYGVRGLWLAALAACGLGLGWLVLLAFGRLPAPVGLAGPAVALGLLAFLAYGALGALAGAAGRAPDRAADGDATEESWSVAWARMAAPPPWFDCAYAALGGTAEAPGRCALTPPTTLAGETPSAPAQMAAAVPDPAPSPDPVAPPPEAPLAAIAPSAPAPLSAPDDAPAAFAIPDPDTDRPAVLAGSALSSPAAETLDQAVAPPEPADPIPAPDGAPAPGPIAIAASEPTAGLGSDDRVSEEMADPPAPVDVLATAAVGPQATADPTPDDPSVAPSRRRSALVCFPMLAAHPERLCPDATLSAEDVEVSWAVGGAEARAFSEGVECHVDPALTPHVVLALRLGGGLLAPLPRGGTAVGAEIPKGDALYAAATQLVGAARAAGDGAVDAAHSRLLLSLFVINGSSLLSPWASQDFGPGRADRVFDVRSGGQSLALLRRLKEELQGLRADRVSGDLAAALAPLLDETPTPAEGRAHPVVVLLTDPTAPPPEAEEARRISALFRESGRSLHVIEIGALAPHPAYRALAEGAGGAALSAADAMALGAALERIALRARSFCAVRVTAPAALFDAGPMTLKLRREVGGSCVLEQAATLDCADLSMSERVIEGVDP